MAEKTEKARDRARVQQVDDDDDEDISSDGKDFLDIADLKEMSISKLTNIAKELDVPGATGMR